MNKGFMLIELLAVIVILAIINIITISVIGNVIETAKEKTFKESINFLIDAIEIDQISNKKLNNEEIIYYLENNKLQTDGRNVEYKGKFDGNGYIKVKNNDYEIKISNKDYCYLKSLNMNEGYMLKEKCIDRENLLYIDKSIQFPYNLNGVIIDYDSSTQTFTVNGTFIPNSATDQVALALATIPFQVTKGEQYTVSIVPLNNTNKSGHMNLNFELRSSKFSDLTPRHYVADEIVDDSTSTIYSRTMHVSQNDEEQTKYAHIYFWCESSKPPTVNDFKFKVMINRGTKENWIPSFNA